MINKFERIINLQYNNEILEFRLDPTGTKNINLYSIAIQPQHRGKNIATSILDDLISFARIHKYRISLMVAYSDRLSLTEFYSKFGFKTYGSEMMELLPK